MATTNEELINQLIVDKVLRSARIIDAFRKIDRAKFVPATEKNHAYDNRPLPIGFGQTISQPLTVAIMLEAVQAKERDHVLDIGAGSGWVTALLAELVGPRGAVTAVERVPQLARRVIANLEPFNFRRVEIVTGDASRGWPDGAPYDVIHVAAAAPTMPDGLKEQLADGGRLVIPIGEYVQELAIITKTGDNAYTEKRFPGFQFVPLISNQPK